MSSSKKTSQEPQGEGGEKRARYETIEDVLPAEILMEIFKCLPTSTLNSCRNVNRKWNEISSSLLRHRPETLLKFFLCTLRSFERYGIPNQHGEILYDKIFVMMVEGPPNKKYVTLREFMDCYKNSKNFPLTRFSFFEIYDGGDDLKTFLTQFGSKILFIKISPPENKVHAKLLLKLLIEYCPNLQELVFDDFGRVGNQVNYSGNLKLFMDENSIVSLPNLKIVHLSKNYNKYLGVVQDILRVATSLKEIKGDWKDVNSGIKVEDIEFLSKVGKLHLVKSATLKGDELAAHWKKFPVQFNKLSKMEIEAKNINMNTFIEHSKDTLKELMILKSGNIIPDVNWSLIPNLQKLSLPANRNPLLTFPVGKNIVLPHLKELEIENTGDVVKKSGSCPVPFPSVKILKLKFDWYASKMIKDVCVIFPNLTCLDLSSVENFFEFGEAIWENMKQLMTLCIYIPKTEPYPKSKDYCDEKYFQNPYEFTPELDSCFTGYSKDTCFELKDQFEGVPAISKDVLLKYDRKNPSIVDMKYLTTLQLKYSVRFNNLYSYQSNVTRQVRKEKANDLKNTISCVTRLFAFQQMPNLQVVIDTEN